MECNGDEDKIMHTCRGDITEFLMSNINNVFSVSQSTSWVIKVCTKYTLTDGKLYMFILFISRALKYSFVHK